MNRLKQTSSRGFTLIEIMVSITIFMVIMTMSLTAMLSVSAQNKKAQYIRSISDNLNFALDTMVRDMRLGSEYHCGVGAYGTNDNCADTPGNIVSFRDKTSAYRWTYSLNTSGQIVRQKSTSGEVEVLTSPDVTLNQMNFYVTGVGADSRQPRAITLLEGKITDARGYTLLPFVFQTMITQRLVEQEP